MLTLAEILAVPREVLPIMLQGYAGVPPGVIAPPCPAGALWLETAAGYEPWEPQTQIAHAWPLVGLWRLQIEPPVDRTCTRWWIRTLGIDVWHADTFRDIPAAICCAVLFLATRKDAPRMPPSVIEE